MHIPYAFLEERTQLSRVQEPLPQESLFLTEGARNCRQGFCEDCEVSLKLCNSLYTVLFLPGVLVVMSKKILNLKKRKARCSLLAAARREPGVHPPAACHGGGGWGRNWSEGVGGGSFEEEREAS